MASEDLSSPQSTLMYFKDMANKRRREANKKIRQKKNAKETPIPLITEEKAKRLWQTAQEKTREQGFRANKDPKDYYPYAYSIVKNLMGIPDAPSPKN